MRPGDLFSLQSSGGEGYGASQFSDGVGWFLVLVQGMIAMLFLLLPVYIVLALLNKEEKKKMLANIIMMALLILLLTWPYKKDPLLNQSEPLIPQPPVTDLPELDFEKLIPYSFVANPKPWMLPLILIGVAVLVAVSTFFTLRFLSNRESSERSPYLDIAENAQTALEEIGETEIDFEDVIIRCYAEMSRTLQINREIQREEAMTTSEFERELLARGFPATPVQRLTQLFEQVRYGRRQTMEADQQVAVESLSEIINHCKRRA